MKSRASSSASLPLKALPLPPSSPDIPDIMEGSDIKLLTETKSPSIKSIWLTDAADFFILLCSFLLTTASIVLVALVFHTQAISGNWSSFLGQTLSILQRAISSLSVTITSAMIMVAGKRYVFFKLARGGLRSRRVAVYSNPSIGNLASYLVSHGAEFPLLGLSAVWGLALVTSLTVGDSWEMGSTSSYKVIQAPFGPFGPPTPGSSWLLPASEQLSFVMSSVCFGVAGTVGLVNISSTSIPTDQPAGIIYYPPLPYSMQNIGFSFSTTMNGFNISMEQLSSVPSTARNLTCVPNFDGTPLDLWSDGSDNQTLSIIATSPSNSSSIFRFNATAIIMGGTLSSTGNYTEFALNGTSWPNVMPMDSQWAQDITSLICNTTSPSVDVCEGSFSDFARVLNADFESFYGDVTYTHWSTMLNMALGAYSSATYQPIDGLVSAVPIERYGSQFMAQYGIYILILDIIVSLIMLYVVVRLRLASHLGADFMNSTRLLLDPLKKPELFDASLKTTVDALEDPYMLVRDDSEFVLQSTGRRGRGGNGSERLSCGTSSIKSWDDSDSTTVVEM
ncbi:hypothetical protein OG21DRAFT_1484007 [Imleria badia]|nr:hypothetical protein OG21DRAFT_1484007 [Imleria badia]